MNKRKKRQHIDEPAELVMTKAECAALRGVQSQLALAQQMIADARLTDWEVTREVELRLRLPPGSLGNGTHSIDVRTGLITPAPQPQPDPPAQPPADKKELQDP